jgi:hypothetical protein
VSNSSGRKIHVQTWKCHDREFFNGLFFPDLNLKSSNNFQVNCTCWHLSTFAVLIENNDTQVRLQFLIGLRKTS